MGSNTKPGGRDRLLARPCYRALLAACVLAALAALPAGALADATPLESSAELPWADPAHQSPIELLASRIASQIAGRPVTVRCAAPAEWTAVVQTNGGDPSAEAGFVATSWDTDTGALVSAASVAELNGESICLPLQRFAEAASKPTKCRAAPTVQPAATTDKRGRLTRAPNRSSTSARSRQARASLDPGPCYLPDGSSAAPMPASFWRAYASYAEAILTLAHESIHLGGIVGGQLADGLPVGDPQAEAKANCYGMQWMPYVAEQLGDSADDAQAIADYDWTTIYPLARSSSDPLYWSAACVRGGALDLDPRLPAERTPLGARTALAQQPGDRRPRRRRRLLLGLEHAGRRDAVHPLPVHSPVARFEQPDRGPVSPVEVEPLTRLQLRHRGQGRLVARPFGYSSETSESITLKVGIGCSQLERSRGPRTDVRRAPEGPARRSTRR